MRDRPRLLGEYYRQFVPIKDVACPCGEDIRIQTRAHILTECLRYEEYRDIRRKVTPGLHIPNIVGTSGGIAALAKLFLVPAHSQKLVTVTYTRQPKKRNQILRDRIGWGRQRRERGGGRGSITHLRKGKTDNAAQQPDDADTHADHADLLYTSRKVKRLGRERESAGRIGGRRDPDSLHSLYLGACLPARSTNQRVKNKLVLTRL